MRLRAFAPLAVAAVVALAAGTPSALAAGTPAKKAIWGPATDFAMYHKLGVGIYEAGLTWASVAPTRPSHPTNPRDPAYHWDPQTAYAIRQAAHYHIRVLLEVITSPAWANGGHAAQNYPPSDPADLASFMTAAARKYPSVHLWMVWGEPNRVGNWATIVPASPSARRLTAAQAAAPRLYARMLNASYGALKAASKRNIVIGGDTFTTGDIPTGLWIKYMRLPNGRPPRMDMYGHNPFCWRAPNLSNPPSPDGEIDFSDLGRLERLVNKNLAPPHHQIKLFLSEWEIPTAPNSLFNFYVTRAVQAQWINDAFRIVRHSSFIYAIGWAQPIDDPAEGLTSGLLDANGQPKPGYYAFKRG